MAKTLTMVVHGESGVGKSWLGASAPAPRLILDTEGGVQFVPQAADAAHWDDLGGAPPEADTVIVTVRDLATIQKVYSWLNAGKHPFKSVVFDSLSEMQKRVKKSVRPSTGMRTQDWGALLDKMEDLVGAFRDLVIHPSKPVENVIFICGTKVEGETGRLRPMLQGQMGSNLAYYVDVVAYMALVTEDDGTFSRRAVFMPIGNVSAKDRTDKLGEYMDDPTVPKLRGAVHGEKEE